MTTEDKQNERTNIQDRSTFSFLLNASDEFTSKCFLNDSLLQVVSQMRCNILDIVDPKNVKDGGIHYSEMCKKCGSQGLFKLKVLPVKNKTVKLRNKLNSMPNLSKFKQNLLDFLKQRKDNVLVLTCLICKNRSKFGMNNPSKNMTVVNKADVTLTVKKKKKNKKDSFVGLTPRAVLAMKEYTKQKSGISNADRTVETPKNQTHKKTKCQNVIEKNISQCQNQVEGTVDGISRFSRSSVSPLVNLRSNVSNLLQCSSGTTGSKRRKSKYKNKKNNGYDNKVRKKHSFTDLLTSF